ncbi:YnbE family lipoprotein [Methylomonas sp. MgM2]
MNWSTTKIASILFGAFYLAGCSPSVKLEAPEKPIEITMNVKIEHEIRLKVEKDVDNLISSNKDLF